MTISPISGADGVGADLLVNALTELFKFGLQGIGEAQEWLSWQMRERDPFRTAATRYAEQLQERYGYIKIFGMTSPVPLREVYVSVNVLSHLTARGSASVEDLEAFMSYETRSFGVPIATHSAEETLRKFDRLIVLGKPGAGKTTFLKHTAFNALSAHSSRERLPIFVSLKDWSDSGEPIFSYIVRQFGICAFPKADGFVERMLSKGKAIVLFDGLDEVTRDIELTSRSLRDFVDKYHTCKFVISCRIAAYNYVFDRFTDVEIADFSDEQVRQFVANWFGDGSLLAENCWRDLCADPPTKELAKVPLLLALVCLAFGEQMRLPPNRSELYKEAIDALLKRWDASRGIKRDEAYKILSLPKKEAMLAVIAARTFERKAFFVPHRVITAYIDEFMGHLLTGATAAHDEIDSDAILRSIIAQHGLFVERAKGIFSFLHLTFHEYFTARYIERHQGQILVEAVVDEHGDDPQWREVILLTAGMLAEADRLIERLLAKIKLLTIRQEGVDFLELVKLAPRFANANGLLSLNHVELRHVWRALGRIQADREAPRIVGMASLEGSVARVRGLLLRHSSMRKSSVPPAQELEPKGWASSMVQLHSLLAACLAGDCYIMRDARSKGLRQIHWWDSQREVLRTLGSAAAFLT